MQYVKLFIASSINEFHALRFDLGNYVRILNDELVLSDRHIDMLICEDMSNAMYPTRKQDEYNAGIRTCQLFVILCGKRMGQYTLEEFETAYQTSRQKGRPLIHVCRMPLPPGEEPEDSARDFFNHVEDYKIPVHQYASESALKMAVRDVLLTLF